MARSGASPHKDGAPQAADETTKLKDWPFTSPEALARGLHSPPQRRPGGRAWTNQG
ncbi:hypothetical protein CNECB9_2370002 [Cupriavidus necator]|uniref:Uncharacterized protein n=1 Tax=Cupriavidus necator TaxID=106590 RepID=A0A1K0IE25_CUPNE|nr:hypothetical protein CNECB9_2370002 [Cupriavidus necator]